MEFCCVMPRHRFTIPPRTPFITPRPHRQTLKDCEAVVGKVSGVSDLLNGNVAKDNRKNVREGLKKVGVRLDRATSSGKDAELALKRAKEQGDKEAGR